MHVHDVYNHMPEPPHLTQAVTSIPISQKEGDSVAVSQEEQQAIKQCDCLLYLLPVHWYTKEFVDIFRNLKYQQTVARHHDLSNNVGTYTCVYTMISTLLYTMEV